MRPLDSRWIILIVWVMAALAAPAAWAQDAQTDQAQELLKQGLEQYQKLNFSQARATLLKAYELRDRLSDKQKKDLDACLNKVGDAVKSQSADLEAMDEAKKAAGDGDLAKARDLYDRVAKSEFVQAEVRKAAAAERAVVVEKMKLAKTDAPVGPSTQPAAAKTTRAPDNPPAVASPELPDKQAAVAPAAVPPVKPAATATSQPADKARDLTAKGDAALADGDVDQAVTCYDQALAVLPGYEPAIQGKARTRGYIGQDSSPLSRLEQRRRIQLQTMLLRYDQLIQMAREAIQAPSTPDDFTRALGAIDEAQTLLTTSRDLLTDSDYRTRVLDTKKLREFIDARKADWDKRQAGVRAAEIDKERRQHDAEVARQKADTIATLTLAVRTLRDEERYDEAVEQLDRILRMDATNAWAKEWQGQLTRTAWLKREKQYHTTGLREEVKQLVDLRDAQTPWYELVRHPADWREITQRRLAGGAGEAAESEANRAAQKKMRQVLPKLDLTGISFNDAINFLREVGSVNIYVNWGALQAVGIDKNTPVNVKLNDVTIEKALRTILADVGGVNPLGYIIDEGVVTISTKVELATSTKTFNYDIRDLIIRVPNFQGPSIDLTQSGTNTGTGNNAGTSGGTGLFSNNTSTTGNCGATGGTEENYISRQDLITQILSLITDTVDRKSWVVNSGDVGTIRELGGQLIVTQTSENHRSLADLLAQLREARTLQINIEARFISVSSSFLNHIGIDMDFYFNIGADPSWRQGPGGTAAWPVSVGRFTTDPVTGARITQLGPQNAQWMRRSAAEHWSPIPVQMNTSSYGAPVETGRGANITSTVTGDALNIAATYLDGIQADFLIQATQAHLSARTLLAPRISIFNGQRAYIVVAQQYAYVSGYEPIIAQTTNAAGVTIAAAAFGPVISTVSTGTVLDVEGTISADRRYVTMTIRPTESNIDNIRVFPGVVGGAGDIELPIVSTRKLECTVSVPDKGTLLLGGLKEAGEMEREMGVPLLSKIPVLNRAFTNRSKVRDERTLLIMVKPTIIILKEYEDAAFAPTQ